MLNDGKSTGGKVCRPKSMPSLAESLDFLRRHSWLALVVFTLGPALILRGFLFFLYPPESVSPTWLLAATRGLASDAAFCLTLALVLYRPFSGKATGPLVVGMILSLLYAGNHEHLLYNYAHANFALAHLGFTKEVLFGNFLIAPVFEKAAIAFASSLALIFGISLAVRKRESAGPRPSPGPEGDAGDTQSAWTAQDEKDGTNNQGRFRAGRRWRGAWLLPGILVAVAILLPRDIEHPDFAQTSVWEANLRHLAGALLPPEIESPALGGNAEGAERFHARDLSGSPVISFPGGSRDAGDQPNILFVVLEGWDRYIMEAGHTPNLESLAERGLFFPNVIAHQVQTNRGLYSILCGDYPNLLLTDAKPDIIGEFGAARRCLPEMLAERGYRTVFMQSANLGFMRKDRFAAAAGFAEIYGEEHYAASATRTNWGVDDGTLMRDAFEKITRLSDGSAPWMVTLLTSGTHPPYAIPGSYREHSGVDRRERAFRFADKITGQLVEELRASGQLENTWVFILTDEASTKYAPEVAADYIEFMSEYYNRAPAIVLAPGRPSLRLPGFYGLKDIMISVLDLLGPVEPEVRGRSLFREYPDSVPILAASLYMDLFFVRVDEAFTMCSRTFDECNSRRLDDATGQPAPREADQDQVAAARRFSRTNDFGYEHMGEIRTVFEERATLHKKHKHKVIGDRHVDVQPGDRLTWRILLAAPASNQENGMATLFINDRGAKQAGMKMFTEDWTIAPGESVRFTKDRVFDENATVVTELILRTQQQEDGVFVREASIVRSEPGEVDR